jgi:hypothetical protein
MMPSLKSLLLLLLLHKYMNSVITGSGTYIPKQADIDNNIIDYAASLKQIPSLTSAALFNEIPGTQVHFFRLLLKQR